MRTIKFRGKSLENGEWLYGDLIHYEWEPEQPYPYIQTGMERNEHGIMQTRGGRVNPSTVGQFTGLYDMNGTEIYEGDILRLPPKNGFEEKNFVSFEVFWHDNDDACYHIGWQINRLHYNGCICGYEMGVINFLPKWTSKMVVIGNIHDNSELLKGENNE